MGVKWENKFSWKCVFLIHTNIIFIPHHCTLGKWLACQSMDNQILIYNVLSRFRQNTKKIFKGHMVRHFFFVTFFSYFFSTFLEFPLISSTGGYGLFMEDPNLIPRIFFFFPYTNQFNVNSVSYTHLTLPTIYSV